VILLRPLPFLIKLLSDFFATGHLGVWSHGLAHQEPILAPRHISIAVLGGGIGGLAAALSLLRAGFVAGHFI
jgi:hypothetical protein